MPAPVLDEAEEDQRRIEVDGRVGAAATARQLANFVFGVAPAGLTLPIFGAARAAGQHRLAGALRTKCTLPAGLVGAGLARSGSRFGRGADPDVGAGSELTHPFGAREGLPLSAATNLSQAWEGHTGPGSTVVVPVEAVASGEVGSFGAGLPGSGAEFTTTGGAAVVGEEAMVFPRHAGVTFPAANDTTPLGEITTQAGPRTLQVRLTGLAEPGGRPTTGEVPRDRRAHQIGGAAAELPGADLPSPEGWGAAPLDAFGAADAGAEPRAATRSRAALRQAAMAALGGGLAAAPGSADIPPRRAGRPDGQGRLTSASTAGDAPSPTIAAQALVVAFAAASQSDLRRQDPGARAGEFTAVEGGPAVAAAPGGETRGLGLGIVAQPTRLHGGL